MGSWKVLTWGGLRGGISVALALSLPPGGARDTVLALTYGVVVFSILAQGLSVGASPEAPCGGGRDVERSTLWERGRDGELRLLADS